MCLFESKQINVLSSHTIEFSDFLVQNTFNSLKITDLPLFMPLEFCKQTPLDINWSKLVFRVDKQMKTCTNVRGLCNNSWLFKSEKFAQMPQDG